MSLLSEHNILPFCFGILQLVLIVAFTGKLYTKIKTNTSVGARRQ
jgi:hypothetical protein